MAQAKKSEDLGQSEVQKNVDVAEDQGFLGRKVDPRPNSDYSLESGPDAPPLVEDINTRVGQVGPGEVE